ncbi:hypothetical protein ACC759_38455, partial [Rhizobium ruizarguesonis]
LSAMGVQIGPLIAGAGIAGVAIGFCAQTLVKDILSGVFYLLDDAFRVGEYWSPAVPQLHRAQAERLKGALVTAALDIFT